MSASAALQAAVVQSLSVVPALTGVFDGPPARAEYPYAVVDCGRESDWSSASHQGRELAVELTVWDDRPSRLLAVEADVENCLDQVNSMSGWALANCRFMSKARIRDPDGPWASRMQFRARLIAIALGSGGGS